MVNPAFFPGFNEHFSWFKHHSSWLNDTVSWWNDGFSSTFHRLEPPFPVSASFGVGRSAVVPHGSLNVPIEHHPTIRYMVYNGYYKVMSNIPKMGQLPTPVPPEDCGADDVCGQAATFDDTAVALPKGRMGTKGWDMNIPSGKLT